MPLFHLTHSLFFFVRLRSGIRVSMLRGPILLTEPLLATDCFHEAYARLDQ